MTKLSITIPPTSWPMVDPESGTPTVDWWNFFYSQSLKLGGTNDQSLTSIAATAEQASVTAIAAQARANLAESTAVAAEVLAGAAQTTANTALAVANSAGGSAGSISASALLKANNLSDVASLASARTNLGLGMSGPTAARPSPYLGQSFFDTTLNRPIWWTGSAWIKADGTVV